MRIHVEVELLEILVPDLREDLLAGAGLRDHALEDLADRRSLCAPVAGVAAGNHVGHDASLAVRRACKRYERPLPRDEVLDFDRIANRENVSVARAHLFVDADASPLAELEAGHLRERGLRTHADGHDYDVRPDGSSPTP